MKENRLNKIADLINKRNVRVSGKISSTFKGSKSFGGGNFSPEEKIMAVEKMTVEDRDMLLQEFGAETLIGFFSEVVDLRRKMGV